MSELKFRDSWTFELTAAAISDPWRPIDPWPPNLAAVLVHGHSSKGTFQLRRGCSRLVSNSHGPQIASCHWPTGRSEFVLRALPDHCPRLLSRNYVGQLSSLATPASLKSLSSKASGGPLKDG